MRTAKIPWTRRHGLDELGSRKWVVSIFFYFFWTRYDSIKFDGLATRMVKVPFLEEGAIIFLNVNLNNVLKTKPNNTKQLRLSIYKTQHWSMYI
jgi:hypothetical protein